MLEDMKRAGMDERVYRAWISEYRDFGKLVDLSRRLTTIAWRGADEPRRATGGHSREPNGESPLPSSPVPAHSSPFASAFQPASAIYRTTSIAPRDLRWTAVAEAPARATTTLPLVPRALSV